MNRQVKAALKRVNQSDIARHYGITRAAVSQWRTVPIPWRKVKDPWLQEMLGLEPHQMRPDIFDPPPKQPEQCTKPAS